MRLLVVTVVHTPLDARIHHRQLRALAADGVEVTYAAPWTATATPPDDLAGALRLVDLPRAVGRRRLAAWRAARRLLRREGRRHDLVLLHDPELVVAAAGLRRLPPVVLDVHEDLAASLPDRPWVPRRLRPVVARAAVALERWAEARLHLLLAEDGYRRRFRRDHPVVPNLPWLPSDTGGEPVVPRVVYVGRISRGRGADELFALGRRLQADGGRLRLELVGPPDGDVRADLDRTVAAGAVVWHGFQPNDVALELVRGSVAGLSLLHDLPNYRSSMPTKLVEYLSVGVPVVTTPLPAAVELVERTGAGMVVPFGDVDGVHAAVERLVADPEARRRMGAAGRAHVAEQRSWDAAAPAFVAHLRELAGGST